MLLKFPPTNASNHLCRGGGFGCLFFFWASFAVFDVVYVYVLVGIFPLQYHKNILMLLWYSNGRFLQIDSIFLLFFLEEAESYKWHKPVVLYVWKWSAGFTLIPEDTD